MPYQHYCLVGSTYSEPEDREPLRFELCEIQFFDCWLRNITAEAEITFMRDPVIE